MRRLVAVSDFCTHVPPLPLAAGTDPAGFWQGAGREALVPSHPAAVTGGYLERLPLAAVMAGLVEAAEVWTFSGDDQAHDSAAGRARGTSCPRHPGITRRVFRADPHPAPYGSADILAHLAAAGVPEILCVWGLGVSARILQACRGALRIYNSIDAPALRMPEAEAREIDLFLTGAEWQSQEIRARVPGARCLVLPIGPEFASGDTFFPTGAPKDRDVVYVACAQEYKRHDILFDALARRPGTRALLVIGYGHLTGAFRAEIARRGLDVEIVEGLDHAGVNRQINRAHVGVVCGQHDGGPAILTEYALAGLPVLANADLCCGLNYITPETGLAAAPGADFAAALGQLIAAAPHMRPRPAALARWGWPASIERLSHAIAEARASKAERIPA